ncbi:hypothetical protein [Streptomyces spongiae]|uniref:hypothetical protein n=1 Tax=Streptomyces spongiae TaxID=565072 RepID=UPI001883BC7F|nr:hypothetical protein [Streptomyces spongiae]
MELRADRPIAVIDSAKLRYSRHSSAENSRLASLTAIPKPTMRMVAGGGKVTKFPERGVQGSRLGLSRL